MKALSKKFILYHNNVTIISKTSINCRSYLSSASVSNSTILNYLLPANGAFTPINRKHYSSLTISKNTYLNRQIHRGNGISISSSDSNKHCYNEYNHRYPKFFSSASNATMVYSNHNDLQPQPQPSSSQKIIPFVLPDIGEGIAEVEILKWCISPGDKISQFDNVCEVQSDKAKVEITSRYDGIVYHLDGNVNDIIKTGTPLFHVIVNNDNDNDNVNDNISENVNGNYQTLNNIDDKDDRLSIPSTKLKLPLLDDTKSSDNNNNVLTSPAVRKLGKENNIKLSSIVGTGPNGRILKSDLLKLLNGNEKNKINGNQYDNQEDGERMTHSKLEEVKDNDEIVPIRGFNRIMFKTTTSSLQIPHMVYSDEVNVTSLLKLKKQSTKKGKITILPFIIKAASLSLKSYPILNSMFNDDGNDQTIIKKKNHNIGIAIDTKNGLVVPVIKNVQLLSMYDINLELKRLQKLANDNMLKENDTNVKDCTFSISNIGAIGGGTYMSPIIIPPQISIAAFGKIQKLPRFKDPDNSLEVEAIDCMNISLAADHRVIDGATLARFCQCWKNYLEDPSSMVLHLK